MARDTAAQEAELGCRAELELAAEADADALEVREARPQVEFPVRSGNVVFPLVVRVSLFGMHRESHPFDELDVVLVCALMKELDGAGVGEVESVLAVEQWRGFSVDEAAGAEDGGGDGMRRGEERVVVEFDGGGVEVADAAGQGGDMAVHAAVGVEAVGVGSRCELLAGDEEWVVLGKRRSVDLGADLGGQARDGGGCESGGRVGSARRHAAMLL